MTYCPLCDSAAVFDRRDGSVVRQFGVSGLLYNSNVLMYDRNARSDSLWSQLLDRGVSGQAANRVLKTLPLELTTWEEWRRRNPTTKVLSPVTGYRRDYRTSPYERYFRSPQLMFPVRRRSNLLKAKEPVLGVWAGQAARAYPVSAFRAGNLPVLSFIVKLDRCGRFCSFGVESAPPEQTTAGARCVPLPEGVAFRLLAVIKAAIAVWARKALP